MTGRAAVLLGLLFVAVAVGLGLSFGRVFRPPNPTPRFVSVTTSPAPSRTRTPIDEATLFRQQVSGGCATMQSVWVITNGGGLLRFDGTSWEQVDDTLRSLTRIACSRDAAYAVGLVGEFLITDEIARQIRSTALTTDNMYGVSVIGDGAMMVGANGAVFILQGGTLDVDPRANAIDGDLRDVAAFSLSSAWAVGKDGITYRLDARGWNPVGSGQTKTLNAIAAHTSGDPIAVGDGGVIVSLSDGAWRKDESGVTANLRDVIVTPQLWIAGDGGTLLTGDSLSSLHPVDLQTTCNLVSVSAQGLTGDIFVIGAQPSGSGGGVWLLRRGAVVKKWGAC